MSKASAGILPYDILLEFTAVLQHNIHLHEVMIMKHFAYLGFTASEGKQDLQMNNLNGCWTFQNLIQYSGKMLFPQELPGKFIFPGKFCCH
jgi:hypothetical protein